MEIVQARGQYDRQTLVTDGSESPGRIGRRQSVYV